jgi:aminobenzoyl-glutamate transport protein
MSEDIRGEDTPDIRRPGLTQRFLDAVEWAGNKLPDPAMLFLIALVLTWVLSLALSGVAFTEADPSTIRRAKPEGDPIRIVNQLTGPALVKHLTGMVKIFTGFHPLGVVLVALLGVGVAEHTGFIGAVLKGLLSFTPALLLTPMLALVAIVSHTAGDTGYVLVIPLGGVIFYTAGRHPLAGIVAAFAGVSGGFSANFIPSGLDPLLQGFTESAAQLINPERSVNPLCNWFFMSLSSVLVVGVVWFLTDYVIEPRLRRTAVDGNPDEMPRMENLQGRELAGLAVGLGTVLAGFGVLAVLCLPANSPLRSPSGSLTDKAPLMEAIVPLIFFFFLIPGVVYGYVAGTVRSHRDIVKGMSKSMSTMGYYLVLAFFAAQFIYAFGESKLGALVAVKGANLLKSMALPPELTIVGLILITTTVNLLIGSASAKWALLGPIFVPMMMQLGLSPELTQAAYRVGDSSTNIITPLMPYFPLIVVYCQRYVKNTGIGTLASLMLPYSLTYLTCWTLLLLVYWRLGLPLGLQAPYTYP